MKISVHIETDGAQAEALATALLAQLNPAITVVHHTPQPTPAAPVVVPEPPIPVHADMLVCRPKQGDKTNAIRACLRANPGGVTPRAILAHLRGNFAWAAETKSLANTVHTTLTNLRERDLIEVIDTSAGRHYRFVSGAA